MPFTVEQFLAVFARYNETIWPVQLVAYALGLVAVVLVFTRLPCAPRAVSAILAVFWLWMGVVYHALFFSQINPAALVFGALFVLQGILWVYVGVLHNKLAFHAPSGAAGIMGWLAVLYAMLVYPLLGTFFGHGYPYAPMFGVTPCPTTIFTFGLLLWAQPRIPKYPLVIPLLWSIVGFSAALSLGIHEDYGLPIAALIGTAIVLWRDGHPTDECPTTGSSYTAAKVGMMALPVTGGDGVGGCWRRH